MKSILVPTDFSTAAENAARYALQIAKRMRTGIELCHAFSVPIEAPGAAQVAWPLADYTAIKADVTSELSCLSGKLIQEEQSKTNPESYRPAVNYRSEEGTVKDMIRNRMADEQLNLVVMGMSGAGGLSRFLLGSQSRELINSATFPVLLIPPKAPFIPIRKIAFATDLNPADIEVIHSVAALARWFNAELLIAHCTEDKYETGQSGQEVSEFLTGVSGKAGYGNIYYRHIKSTGIDRGLDWLTEHGQVDILAMVHHPQHFLAKLLTASHTQAMARHIHIPLLVFPPAYCGTF